MSIFRIHLILPLIFIMTGCASSSERSSVADGFETSVIISSVNGEGLGDSPGAAWIDDEEGLRSFTARLSRMRLGGETPSVPEIDYEKEGVLAIWMGKMPAGGYRIELASSLVSVQDGTAIVSVRWTVPAKDAVLTQRITGPCLAIRMKRGGYARIKAMDEAGVIRAETVLKKGQD
jgi:hypothetical protein